MLPRLSHDVLLVYPGQAKQSATRRLSGPAQVALRPQSSMRRSRCCRRHFREPVLRRFAPLFYACVAQPCSVVTAEKREHSITASMHKAASLSC